MARRNMQKATLRSFAVLEPRIGADLGEAFSSERNRQIDGDCGRIENVKRLVQKALDSGILGGEQD